MAVKRGRRLGALLIVLFAAACSSFGETAAPGSDGGASAADGAAASETGSTTEGGTEEASDGCRPFSNDFASGDLAANGFVTPVGNVSVGSDSGKDGGGLVAKLTLVSAGSGETSYASRQLDIEAGRTFASVDVSFDVFTGRPPAGAQLVVGCILYARASLAASETHDQARVEADPNEVRLELESRVDNVSKGTKDAKLTTPLPVADAWHHVSLSLRRNGDEFTSVASLDGVALPPLDPVPAASGDPRLVSVKCGIPFAVTTGSTPVTFTVRLDNLSGKVCTTPR